MEKEKVVLAYSGGLDTTVIIPWLQENYNYDVIAACIEVGQGKETDGLEEKALKNYKDKSEQVNKKYFNEDEIKDVILKLCKNIYPYFESRGIEHPKIKFRKMVSRWGSCNITKKVLTFNINLMYAPAGCIEYVVLHEFTHFLQPNHSSKFYEELEKICPDWKKWRKCLKEINLYENM